MIVPLLCAGLLAGCGANQSEDELAPAPRIDTRTIVAVDNQDFLDMTVYVLEGSQRVRLGVAAGNMVSPMAIPAHLVRGPAPLRFYCDPIGGNRTPVSDEIVVYPGDEVMLTIPSG